MVVGLLSGLGQVFGLDVDVTVAPRADDADHDLFVVVYALPSALLAQAFPFHSGSTAPSS